MRDFERIEVLIKEDSKLEKAIAHEISRCFKISDTYEEVGARSTANIYTVIGNSLTTILGEKTGFKTKEFFDQETEQQIQQIKERNRK